MEIEIYRDGQLDADYVRQQRIASISNIASTMLKATGAAVGGLLSEIGTGIKLEFLDIQNGSHLRDEYRARKEQERMGKFIGRLGLSS